MAVLEEKKLGRVAKRQARNRQALIAAGAKIMAEKGIGAATMVEIADLADVGAGTVYSYFRSKDELALAVLEGLMHDLGIRIEQVTNTFDDPGQVYAYGIRTTLETAIHDPHWNQLLNHTEVIAGAMYRSLGPFAMRDLDQASVAGRFDVPNPKMIWKMTTLGMVGYALSVLEGELPQDDLDECVVSLLCMTGIGRDAAEELANRDRPILPVS